MRVLRNELYRPWFVGEQTWGFEIIDGEFKDVVVQIEKIEFVEDKFRVSNSALIQDDITDEDINGEYESVEE